MRIRAHEKPSSETGPDAVFFEWRRLGALALDEVTIEGEVMQDIVIPEVSEEYAATMEDRPSGDILLACGDDRGITAESIRYLVSQGLPADSPYARYFGGLFGFSHVVMTAVAAQHGAAGLRDFMGGSDYVTATARMADKARQHGRFIPTAHSSEQNERNPAKLDTSAKPEQEIACAYGLNEGEIIYINGNNRKVRLRSQAEFKGLFGPHVSRDNIEVAADANRSFARVALGDDARNFSITRRILLDNKVPSMVLRGSHAEPEDTFVVLNFSTDKLTNPNLAEDQGFKSYGCDLTQMAESVMRTFLEYKLDPEILMATMILDIAATRTALTAHSPNRSADPERIALVRYGDPVEALEYLRHLQ